MQGTIIQVNISRGGVPKLPIGEGIVTPFGIEGDLHSHADIHGGPDQAVLLITMEGIEELTARGYQLYPGALGENLTIRGLSRRHFRIGQQIRAGSAMLEITRQRMPCRTLDVYGEKLKTEMHAKDETSPAWGLSGFHTRVLQPGRVCADDIISIVATLA